MKTKLSTICARLIIAPTDNLASFLHRIMLKLHRAVAPFSSAFAKRFPRSSACFRRTIAPKTVFLFLCALSVLSQASFFTALPGVRTAVICLWGIGFLCFASTCRLAISGKTIRMLLPLVLFDISIFLIGVCRGNISGYLASPIAYSANLSGFLLLAGACCGACDTQGHKPVLFAGGRVYVFCALAVAAYTLISNFSGFWNPSMTYVYAQKNSLAPIVVTAMGCIIFLKLYKDTKLSALFLFSFSVFLVLLKSRSAIFGLVAALFIWWIYAISSGRTRWQVAGYTFLEFVLIMIIPTLRNFIVGEILLNNRASMGLNEISSGRTEQYAQIPESIPHTFLFGNGSTYIESFPLASFASFGIIATLILFVFACTPLFISYTKQASAGCRKNTLLLRGLALGFLMIALFEERAPFGPGTSYFFLWFSAGFLAEYKQKSVDD